MSSLGSSPLPPATVHLSFQGPLIWDTVRKGGGGTTVEDIGSWECLSELKEDLCLNLILQIAL